MIVSNRCFADVTHLMEYIVIISRYSGWVCLPSFCVIIGTDGYAYSHGLCVVSINFSAPAGRTFRPLKWVGFNIGYEWGGTGERVGRGGRGRRPREGNDERVEDLNGQGNDQGLGANEGERRGILLVNGNRVGCVIYKEFLACNPKEYDGKGGAIVLTRWIEKMENVQDMSGCSNDQKVKYTDGSFVGKALTWWNSQNPIAMPRWFTLKKVEKRGNVGEPSKDKNGRDDNKRTRTGNVFDTTVNPIGRENMGFNLAMECRSLLFLKLLEVVSKHLSNLDLDSLIILTSFSYPSLSAKQPFAIGIANFSLQVVNNKVN
ncbi:hypothetical protein Tco_0246462 [Tanacetum coccineum]